MSARQTGPAWIVLRWQEGAESHGHAAWWRAPKLGELPQERTGAPWTRHRKRATTMTQAEAERMADDWNSYAAMKGRPERYRAEPAEKEANQ